MAPYSCEPTRLPEPRLFRNVWDWGNAVDRVRRVFISPDVGRVGTDSCQGTPINTRSRSTPRANEGKKPLPP
jgi:hypothetical protein